MADILATVADLRTLLGEDGTGLADVEGQLLLELATGAVQAAAGQLLLAQVDDEATLIGTMDSWLALPEQPVTGVTSVTVDGDAVTDFTRFGARLWRESGWSTDPYRPTPVAVVYSHGYATGDQRLQLARSAVLATAAQMFANPGGATGLSVDDYREQYSQSSDSDLAGMVPARLRAALRRAYGRRGGLVRVG
jgi:hypothetical protein